MDSIKLVRLPLLTMSLLLCLGPMWRTGGEQVFHTRLRYDLQSRSRTQQRQTITTASDAQGYLIHYGYANCSLRQRRGSGLAGLLGVINEEMEIQEPKECSETELREAMSKFQTAFGLPNTGTLNDATKDVMSTSRCGNKDSEEEEDGVFPPARSANVGRSHVIRRRRSVEDVQDGSMAAGKRPGQLSQLLRLAGAEATVEEGHPKKRKTRSDMYHEMKSEIHRDQWARFLKKDTAKERRERDAAEARSHRSQRRKRELASNETFVNDLPEEEQLTLNTDRLEWTWRLLKDGLSGKLPVNNQLAILALAYRIWSEVIPITFQEDPNGAVTQVDVTMGFGKHVHLDCTRPFDGPGGVIAHSYRCHTPTAGRQSCVHIDEDECYRGFMSMMDRTTMDVGCVYLLQVALHEIGHVLGLNHSNNHDSIMYPVMPAKNSVVELSTQDRLDAQQIWGVCGGSFDTAFDWVRKKRIVRYDEDGFPFYAYSYYYNSYFYREDNYWMYENRARRPRYGDPLYIPSEWRGIPTYVDAAVQVFFEENDRPCHDCAPNFDIHTLFFKDDLYYEYDAENDETMPGFPRRIADDFSPDNSSEERVPDNLDTVFYDSSLHMMLFFKGEYVWALDPVEYMVHQQKGPLVKTRFDDLFIPEPNGNFTLSGSIDAIYYSNANGMTYVFVGELTYRCKLEENHYILYEPSPWYETWRDICDVN